MDADVRRPDLSRDERWRVDIRADLDRRMAQRPDPEAQRQVRERLRYRHSGPYRATLQHIRARYGQQTVGWILVSAGLVLLRILYRWGWIG